MLNRCFDLHMWVPKVPCRLWFHSFENFEKGNGCHPIQKQLEKLTCHQVAWFAMAWTTMSHMQFLLDMSCFWVWHQGKMHQSFSTKFTKARPPGTNRIPSAKKTFKRFSLTVLDSKQIWIACSVTEVWRLTPTCDLKLFLETWVLMKTWCFSAKYSTINYEPGWWLLHCCKQVRSAEANWRLSAILDQLCRILGLAKTGNILNTEPIWS